MGSVYPWQMHAIVLYPAFSSYLIHLPMFHTGAGLSESHCHETLLWSSSTGLSFRETLPLCNTVKMDETLLLTRDTPHPNYDYRISSAWREVKALDSIFLFWLLIIQSPSFYYREPVFYEISRSRGDLNKTGQDPEVFMFQVPPLADGDTPCCTWECLCAVCTRSRMHYYTLEGSLFLFKNVIMI